MLGLSDTDAEECFQILCEDDVFQGSAGQLTAFLTGDFDGNGQRDMAAMIHQYPYGCYGSGCIYIYMNEDEPYCFLDDIFPFYSYFFNEMHISGGDLDNDGTVEILIEAAGTGSGGAGDWRGRILKYRDHGLEKTDMLPDHEVYIEVQVIQETGENAYSAYFPEFDETIAFEARECRHSWQEAECVGGSMGMFDMHCVEYQGGYAMEASACLIGEGGNAHVVALAKFIIVWDGNGEWHVVRWWVEPVEFDWDLTVTRAVTNFLEMKPRDFEAVYDPKADEMYYWGLLYCDKEAWKYDGNQLDPYQAAEDYWEVGDITALRIFERQNKPVYNGMNVADKIDIKDIMDITDIQDIKDIQNVKDIRDSHWLMVDVFDDYAVSVYFEEGQRKVYVREISFIKVKMREGEATEALYRYLEENYYDVRESLEDEEWVKSPNGTKEVCASEGALPKHPLQIFVRQGWGKPDLVFRTERACSVVGWIDEEHIVCDQADMGPILVCLESHEVRQIKTETDDYDSYGADYRLEGDFLIAECMGEEIYRWKIVDSDGKIRLIAP